MTVKILAIAGSARKDSVNAKLLKATAKELQSLGAEVTIVDHKQYNLPLYDGDLEASGTPEAVKKLHAEFKKHDALLIASPEYNSSITPLLKNTIDWVSRAFDQEPGLSAYKDKVAGLIAASPGALGGLRGLVHVRSILGNIGVVVIPEQVAVNNAFEAFNAAGELSDQSALKRIKELSTSLYNKTMKLKG